MRTSDFIRDTLGKFADFIASRRRQNNFVCGDCERVERCGLPPSDKCVHRAEQVSSQAVRPPYRQTIVASGASWIYDR
jgi:hypothetical protein